MKIFHKFNVSFLDVSVVMTEQMDIWKLDEFFFQLKKTSKPWVWSKMASWVVDVVLLGFNYTPEFTNGWRAPKWW